jgi:hypothetical protein
MYLENVKMNEASFYILCLIGTIYLLCRITIFLKTVLQLIWDPKSSSEKQPEGKMTESCHRNWNVLRSFAVK